MDAPAQQLVDDLGHRIDQHTPHRELIGDTLRTHPTDQSDLVGDVASLLFARHACLGLLLDPPAPQLHLGEGLKTGQLGAQRLEPPDEVDEAVRAVACGQCGHAGARSRRAGARSRHAGAPRRGDGPIGHAALLSELSLESEPGV